MKDGKDGDIYSREGEQHRSPMYIAMTQRYQDMENGRNFPLQLQISTSNPPPPP